MNIVFIISDTLRREYLGCYGNSWIQTPNLDMFAREALVFDKTYTGSFPTIPNRNDIMSGRYAFHAQGWAPLPKGTIVVQELLRRAGYVTMLITDHTQMLAPGMNYHQGFSGHQWIRGQCSDRYITDPVPIKYPCDPKKLRQPERLVEPHLRNVWYRRQESDYFVCQTMRRAMNWLERNYTHEKFMLYIDTFDVHEPWDPPRWYVDLYDPGYEGEEVIYPRYDYSGYLTEAELRHVRALYAGEITMLDRWVGFLLQKIKDLGIWDETAIFFTTDHGWYHGEHGYIGKHTVLEPKKGWPLYEEICHIPLIAKIPGLDKGKRVNLLNQPTDLMPTLLDLADVPAPKSLHGRSMLPALRGEEESIRDIAVASPTLSDDPETRVYSTVTDGEWTLVYAGNLAEPELYHLPSDPKQRRNVLEENRDVARDLIEKYIKTLREIGTSERRLRLRMPKEDMRLGS